MCSIHTRVLSIYTRVLSLGMAGLRTRPFLGGMQDTLTLNHPVSGGEQDTLEKCKTACASHSECLGIALSSTKDLCHLKGQASKEFTVNLNPGSSFYWSERLAEKPCDTCP